MLVQRASYHCTAGLSNLINYALPWAEDQFISTDLKKKREHVSVILFEYYWQKGTIKNICGKAVIVMLDLSQFGSNEL